jgi:transcriptional regulator CtsR
MSNINEINDRIISEICYNTINELSDDKLINEYKKCKSVIKEIKLLENILLKYIDNSNISNIIDEYIYNIILAGTKGVIRGNKLYYTFGHLKCRF